MLVHTASTPAGTTVKPPNNGRGWDPGLREVVFFEVPRTIIMESVELLDCPLGGAFSECHFIRGFTVLAAK